MDKTTWEERRKRAVQRLLRGEAFTVVCLSEGVSRGWLHKWWVRHTYEMATWFHDDSRRPHTQPGRIPAEIEEIVQLVRLELYNRAQFCGGPRYSLAPGGPGGSPVAVGADDRPHLVGPARVDGPVAPRLPGRPFRPCRQHLVALSQPGTPHPVAHFPQEASRPGMPPE